MRAGHQHTDFRECTLGFSSPPLDGALHETQISAAMARFVLRYQAVDSLDDRLGVPIRCSSIPMIKSDLAAEVKHESFKHRCRIEFKTDCVQLILGRNQIWPEPA